MGHQGGNAEMQASSNPGAEILGRCRNVTVIGAGVIGGSWAALFLAHGLNVVVNDPQPDIETTLREMLRKIQPTLRRLGLRHESLDRNVRFEPDLARAVADADVVQENGPERAEWKQELWARIEDAVPKHALLLSSSSARPATEQAKLMKDAGRLLVGHPFNPPHLIPLVEVVPGARGHPQKPPPTQSPSTKRSARWRVCSGARFAALSPTGCKA